MLGPDELELGQFIPLAYHHAMLLDQARVGAFHEAIQKLVQPGSRVVELGGGTGILSHFAAQRAAQVWYVERNINLLSLAQRTFERNGSGKNISLIHADARQYVPPVPVDVVICEMLHSALLREKQLDVIRAFREHYQAAHPGPLPRFIPEATILGVQPVDQEYSFSGYYCPVPIFQDPAVPAVGCRELSDPAVYSVIEWRGALPPDFSWSGNITVTSSGMLTAIRFITKNLVGIFEQEHRSADWLNSHLIIPLHTPLAVTSGSRITVHFSYQAGASIESLMDSLFVDPAMEASLPVPSPQRAQQRG